MRHAKAKFQINRFTSWRAATLLGLAKSLFIQQSIKTTKTKARAAQSLAEKLISLGKQGSLAAKRRAYKILRDHKLVRLLFNDIAPRFKERNSGFTRILNLGNRRGDNACLAILELTEIKEKEKKKAAKEKEVRPEETPVPKPGETTPAEQKKPEAKVKVLERPPMTKKPTKKFLGGLRSIFKKERDSL